MELTSDQRERIRKNKERALEIQKRRREELERNKALSPEKGSGDGDTGPARKKISLACDRKKDADKTDGNAKEEETPLELEEFEVGASKHVTKKEAMKMYLLPEGTLAICQFVEKPNPHHKGWQPMKLYDRAEVRRLSRERFGGLQGVIEERRRRQEKRFRKDLEETKNLFAKK